MVKVNGRYWARQAGTEILLEIKSRRLPLLVHFVHQLFCDCALYVVVIAWTFNAT